MDRIKQILYHPLFRQYMNENAAKETDRIFCKHNLAHVEEVARIACILGQKLFEKDMIYAAALLHDIGRHIQYETGEKHPEAGARLAPEILKDCGFSDAETDVIVRAIAAHGDKSIIKDQSLNGILARADVLSRACYDCKAKALCNWPEERKNKITIHALGDSLVTAYGPDGDNFIGGWGDHLWSFFNEEQVQVKVYAQGGRSSRSFLNEGRFLDYGIFSKEEWPFGMGPACNHIRPGDYVLMQFCHNDDDTKEKITYVDRMTPLGTPDEAGVYPTVVPTEEMKVSTSTLPKEYLPLLMEEGYFEEKIAECIRKYKDILPAYGSRYWSYGCGATYKGYLKFYIDKIREMGAVPVLVTGAARQYFEGDRLVPLPGHHGGKDAFGDYPYVRAVRQLAAEEGVILLDLFEQSRQLFEMLGKEDSKVLQSIKDADGLTIGESRYGRPAGWVEDYDQYWAEHTFSDVDNTHQNRLGSYLFAAILADCIYEQIPKLQKYMLPVSSKSMNCPAKIRDRMAELTKIVEHVGIRLV